MRLDRIHTLQRQIEAISKGPQSAAGEREKARIEFDLRVAQAEREIVVAKRARMLFDAFCKHGRMEVRHPNGGGLVYDGAPHHVSDVQRVFNAKGEADTMASWSEP